MEELQFWLHEGRLSGQRGVAHTRHEESARLEGMPGQAGRPTAVVVELEVEPGGQSRQLGGTVTRR